MAGRQAQGAAWPFAGLGGFVLGAALQLQQAALWAWPAYVLLLGAGLAASALTATRAAAWPRTPNRPSNHSWAPALAALLAAAAVGGGLTGLRACAFAAQALPPALEGRDLLVTGTVAQMPQPVEGGVRLRLDVERAEGLPSGVRPPAGIALTWYAQPVRPAAGDVPIAAAASPRAGERWRLPVRLKAPHGSFNPHGFDLELWAWTQGVQASGTVRSGGAGTGGGAQRLAAARPWLHPVEQAREAVRDAIAARVADARLAGVLAALVAGDQAAIERADWDLFRATGVAHLMSISGLHVTLFAWLAAWAVQWAWRRSGQLMLWRPAQQAGATGGVLLAAAYALFSGWGVPAQRTVCMLAVVALLRGGALHWPWPMVWLSACAAVVLLDPWALLQAGFWLSFVAVGVLFAAGRGEPGAGAGRALVRMLREQAVVTLALTPLTVLLFHQVSLVGLLANLLAIPWVTLGVLPLALLGVLAPPLWTPAAWAVQGLMAVLEALAASPGALLSLPAPPLWAGVAGVAGGVLLAVRLPVPMRLLGLPLMLPALLWLPARPPAGAFEVLVLDVGQGGAALVRTASRTLLFDAGPRYGSTGSDAGERIVVPLLRALGEAPDILVLSHGDSDHVGGAAAVLAAYPHARVAGSLPGDHPLRAARAFTACLAGQAWQWDGVRFEVLHPPLAAAAPGARANAQSCVLRVVAADGASALLTGDIEAPQEAALLDRAGGGDPLKADLLLAPHHGSRTSSSPAFVAAVRPAVVVFQAGYRNRFGHPAAQVRMRYEEAGARAWSSAECGALHWRSGAPQTYGCERELRRRYWHHVPSPAAPGSVPPPGDAAAAVPRAAAP